MRAERSRGSRGPVPLEKWGRTAWKGRNKAVLCVWRLERLCRGCQAEAQVFRGRSAPGVEYRCKSEQVVRELKKKPTKLGKVGRFGIDGKSLAGPTGISCSQDTGQVHYKWRGSSHVVLAAMSEHPATCRLLQPQKPQARPGETKRTPNLLGHLDTTNGGFYFV